MHHLMFDIDGTLIESCGFDSECFVSSVKELVNIDIDPDWSTYKHITDTGILNEILESAEVCNKQVLHNEVKNRFVQKIQHHISKTTVKEISGASSFLSSLKSRKDIVISLATGGWYESATLKLKSAGIDFSGIPIASSNDHFDRTEIMKIAVARTDQDAANSYTYFGDGVWDKMACEKLGFNFVLVGSKLKHKLNIANFNGVNEIMQLIDL